VARRGVRLSDLFHRERFAAKLGEMMDYHNFVLQHYYKAECMDFQQVLDQALSMQEILQPLVADVPELVYQFYKNGDCVLFEGAQGTLLDIDHGTYPYVTSSNTTAGGAATGSGMGLLNFDYVVGITKAYTTRVGSGPFPTELFDELGGHLAKRGHEFGATTGRPRRCGWFDAVALRRASQLNSISGLCITKLDVLDGLDTIRMCVGYRRDGVVSVSPPDGAEDFAVCEAIYEDLPGWRESTVGARNYDELPEAARVYLKRIEEFVETPIDIVSTGPDREETIILRHPFN